MIPPKSREILGRGRRTVGGGPVRKPSPFLCEGRANSENAFARDPSPTLSSSRLSLSKAGGRGLTAPQPPPSRDCGNQHRERRSPGRKRPTAEGGCAARRPHSRGRLCCKTAGGLTVRASGDNLLLSTLPPFRSRWALQTLPKRAQEGLAFSAKAGSGVSEARANAAQGAQLIRGEPVDIHSLPPKF